MFEEYASDPVVTRYLTWAPHPDVQTTRGYLETCRRGWEQGREYTWAITLPPSDRVVGMIACRGDDLKVNLGYVLGRRHWGRGYMPEAGRAVVAASFALPSVARVWATCDVDNRASARVLEKIGMLREGVLRAWIRHPAVSDQPRDSLVYSIVRADLPVRPGDPRAGAGPATAH